MQSGFWWENTKERNGLEDLGTEERRVLKLSLKTG
jgi:hypothetical protein